MTSENILFGSMLLDNALLDIALSEGLTHKHFNLLELSKAFNCALGIRAKGNNVDLTSLTLAGCDISALLAAESAAPTQIHFREALTQVINSYAAKTVLRLSNELPDMAENRELLVSQVDKMLKALETKECNVRTLNEIGQEVEAVALAKINGDVDPRVCVEWPLAKANSVFGPIMPHELVGIAARPKQGKSSLALQIVGHNIMRGLRGAYFTLETSDTASLSLIAGQMSSIDLQSVQNAPRDKQLRYVDTVRALRKANNLQIYDKDMSISAIESRCRLLAATFKPDFIVIDHLHQIHNNEGRSNYEKITDICIRLVELRKKLGCAVIVAIQLNRGSENDDRPPRSADARDSGAIEAAMHRMVLVHRPKIDFCGQPQMGPEVETRAIFDCYLMQELNRDGKTGNIKAKFNAPLSSFQ